MQPDPGGDEIYKMIQIYSPQSSSSTGTQVRQVSQEKIVPLNHLKGQQQKRARGKVQQVQVLKKIIVLHHTEKLSQLQAVPQEIEQDLQVPAPHNPRSIRNACKFVATTQTNKAT